MRKLWWRPLRLGKLSEGLPLLSEQTRFLRHVRRKCPSCDVKMPCWEAASRDYFCNIEHISWPVLSKKESKMLVLGMQTAFVCSVPWALEKLPSSYQRCSKLGQTDHPSSEDEGKGAAGMNRLVRYMCFLWSQFEGSRNYSKSQWVFFCYWPDITHGTEEANRCGVSWELIQFDL